VQATFHAARENLFGPVTRNLDTRTILVTDGTDVYALLHINDTVATFRESPADWREIEGRTPRFAPLGGSPSSRHRSACGGGEADA
jgi:hypothetical protein